MGWTIKPDGKKGREVKEIILHTSDSPFGDAAVIDKWHKERGWKKIGYHYVILNGRRTPNLFENALDGLIEPGRALHEVGAHCIGHNRRSLGVCLIGKGGLYTVAQVKAARDLVADLLVQFSLPISAVFGHDQFSSKTCPNFDIQHLKALVLRR